MGQIKQRLTKEKQRNIIFVEGKVTTRGGGKYWFTHNT